MYLSLLFVITTCRGSAKSRLMTKTWLGKLVKYILKYLVISEVAFAAHASMRLNKQSAKLSL